MGKNYDKYTPLNYSNLSCYFCSSSPVNAVTLAHRGWISGGGKHLQSSESGEEMKFARKDLLQAVEWSTDKRHSFKCSVLGWKQSTYRAPATGKRKQEGRLQSEFRQGKQAAWLDGQMDEETDGWIDGGIGGIVLHWEIKLQINSLTRRGGEFPLECKWTFMIWIPVTGSYLLFCTWSDSVVT